MKLPALLPALLAGAFLATAALWAATELDARRNERLISAGRLQ